MLGLVLDYATVSIRLSILAAWEPSECIRDADERTLSLGPLLLLLLRTSCCGGHLDYWCRMVMELELSRTQSSGGG